MAHLQIPNGDRTAGPRPSISSSKHASSPSVVMNGHFASVGEAPSREQYEHGIQVVNENKEFKYGPRRFSVLGVLVW